MDFAEVRRVIITAVFSDDYFLEHLVLKGGNALNLVYGLSSRTSLDLDFSIDSDFPDLAEARERLSRALGDRFDAAGLVVFDLQLEPKPRLEGEDLKPWWGGYELRFKLIERQKYESFRSQIEKLRNYAIVTGRGQAKTFTVDLSKHEYTVGKTERELDHFTIYVYTPEMIAVEKLRAICQQMPDYPHRGWPSARARDFFDIFRVVTECGIDLASEHHLQLVRNVFAAKDVPLHLLSKIRDYREFHRPDWASVRTSVTGPVEEFDFYFDFVVEQVDRLKTLWME
jgi:predicted nucleotidyltransferase component of viral defense system